MILTGKCSIFGGKDSGMAHTENLSLYWQHHQCDERPDLFHPRSKDLTEGTSHRLKEDAFYCAIRFKPELKERLRGLKIKVTNEENEKDCNCEVCDYGPHPTTGRLIDLSPGAAEYLEIETDDFVTIECDPELLRES